MMKKLLEDKNRIVLLVITGLVLVKLVRKNMMPEEEKEGKED